MISRMQIDFKKYNADGIGCLPPTFPRVASYRRQPWADKSTTPMVLVHVHRFPNKQNHTRNPPKRNQPPMRNPQNGINRPRAICPNETVGAFPYQKYTHGARGITDGCALVGRHGRAHRHRPYQTPSYFSTQSHTNKITIYTQSTQTKPTVPHVICPNDINHPYAIRPYPSPPNHAVYPYPIGVILSIAQGWQVQRSLPWVTMQVRRLPPWGLYFFSSHIITIRGE